MTFDRTREKKKKSKEEAGEEGGEAADAAAADGASGEEQEEESDDEVGCCQGGLVCQNRVVWFVRGPGLSQALEQQWGAEIGCCSSSSSVGRDAPAWGIFHVHRSCDTHAAVQLTTHIPWGSWWLLPLHGFCLCLRLVGMTECTCYLLVTDTCICVTDIHGLVSVCALVLLQVVWMTDTSEEAAKRRAAEQLSAATAAMVTQGNIEAERAEAEKKAKKEAKRKVG